MLEADTSRRTLHIRLDSPEENPELRRGFRHPNLVAHVKQHRRELVAAGLTILAAYHAAGSPRMDLPAWGSFDAWSALIRESLVWCGLPDPGQTREELAKHSDVMAEVLRMLIAGWQCIDARGEGLTTADLLRSLEECRPEYASIRDAICELCGTAGDKLPSTRSLGNHLKKFRGRVMNGHVLDSDDEHGKARWRVRPMNRPWKSCSSCSDGPVSRSVEIGRESLISLIRPEPADQSGGIA